MENNEEEKIEEVVTETTETTAETAETTETTEATDEASIDEAVNEAAEKVLKVINEKMASKKAKAEEIAAKKEAVFGNDVSIVDMKHKMYTTRKGLAVYATMDEAKHCNNWFKSFINFKRNHSPDEYQNMKRESAILEKMAIHQKLEPLNETTDADGGYLVPSIMYNKIVPFLEDMAQIKQNAYLIDMTGIKTLLLPKIGAGAFVSWNSESAQKATTSMVFDQQSLTPYTLAGIMIITQQLLDDAPFPMLQIVSQELARAIAKAEDAAFASGTGVAQPTGIDTYTPIYTTGAGGALTFAQLQRAYYGMPQSHRESTGLRWIMNRRNVMNIAGLVDTTGRPIFDNLNPMSNMTNERRQPQIMGIPVIENNDLSESVIYLVDLQYYYIGYNRRMSIDVATEATIGGVMDTAKGGYYRAGHNLWERNEIAIRAEERVDGELVTTRALTTITQTV